MDERKQKILNQFRKIRSFKKAEQRAPHKPLLILAILGMLTSENTPQRLIGYRKIRPRLKRLLNKFSTANLGYNPRTPFHRLANDEIWEISREDGLKGGFTEAVHAELSDNPAFIFDIAQTVLDAAFPKSLHEVIVKDSNIRLDLAGYEPSLIWQPEQDPDFVGQVLAAYDNKCAVCSHDIRLDGDILGTDAAHIQWRLCDGPNKINNGVALCKTHHTALDFGAISIDKDFKILVSKKLEGNPEIRHFLFDRFADKPLMRPNNPEDLPDPRYLKWHHEWVFKGAKDASAR